MDQHDDDVCLKRLDDIFGLIIPHPIVNTTGVTYVGVDRAHEWEHLCIYTSLMTIGQ